ncbi:MAG: hypothetical protein U1E65_21430 [Myxococcota bacterium]
MRAGGRILSAAVLFVTQSCALLTRDAAPPTLGPAPEDTASCAGEVAPAADVGLSAVSFTAGAVALLFGFVVAGSRETASPTNDASRERVAAALFATAAGALIGAGGFTASAVWGFQHPCSYPKVSAAPVP